MNKNKPQLTVVVPTYNEQENLPKVLPELIRTCKKKNWNLIIANDGSKDKTEEILQGFSDEDEIEIVHNKLNKGYGSAIKLGIINAKTKYIVTIDADGQHYLEDIDKLYSTLTENNADMVIGSRKGEKSANKFRGFGKWIIRSFAKTLMPLPVYDINSGMKLYDADLARKYIHLYPDTMAFSDIITLVFVNNRHLVLEAPIRIKERLGGKSTIGIHTAFETIMEILNIIILFNPMKVFLPISLLFVLLGLGWGIPIMLKGNGVSVGSSFMLITGIITFLLGLIAEQLSAIRNRK